MRSYSFKNFITMAALVLLSFLILSASFVIVGRNYALRERRETIESNAIELSRLSSAYAKVYNIQSCARRSSEHRGIRMMNTVIAVSL